MSSLSVTNEMAQKHRVKALDGLRAFAIIFVLFSHSVWKLGFPINFRLASADFHNLFYNGWLGVDLFFVLSGFLIASQLLNKPLTRDNLRKFCCKRYFRIAPAYYISVILALLFLHVLPSINDGASIYEIFLKWWQPVLSHFSFTHDYLARSPSIDGLFWSIPVEIKFYLTLPLFIYLLLKLRKSEHQIYAIIAFYLLYVASKLAYFHSLYGVEDIKYEYYFLHVKTPFHLALDGLTMGVLSAFILRNDKIKSIKENHKIFELIFYSGLLLFFILSLSPHFLGGNATFFEITMMTPLLSLSFGCALIALVKGCVATKFFSNFILRFIAKISYSMYLTHLYALYFQMELIDKLSGVISSPTLCWLISLPAFFAAAICLAYLLYEYVEKPFINWSRNKWS